jgi:hypothetical protein
MLVLSLQVANMEKLYYNFICRYVQVTAHQKKYFNYLLFYEVKDHEILHVDGVNASVHVHHL